MSTPMSEEAVIAGARAMHDIMWGAAGGGKEAAWLAMRDTLIGHSRAAVSAALSSQAAEIAEMRMALSLAVNMLSQYEPGDSRAVSDEFVALAAVQCGLGDERSDAVIRTALTRKVVKRYFIQIRGFDGRHVTAESAGAARYAEYKAWREAGYDRSRLHGNIDFGQFLKEHVETFHHLGRAALAKNVEG